MCSEIIISADVSMTSYNFEASEVHTVFDEMAHRRVAGAFGPSIFPIAC